MHVLRSTLAVGFAAVVVAACMGGPARTQGPDGGGGGDTPAPQVTAGPVETQSGGGGGGGLPAGWDQYGKVHIEVDGPVEKDADYGFIPAGSIFGGTQGYSLNFGNEGVSEIVSILGQADGSVVVSYSTDEYSIPAAECTTSNWNVGSSSGSGTFDCTAGFVIMASGATLQGATVRGTFDAHT